MNENLTSYLQELLRLVKEYGLAELHIESPDLTADLRARFADAPPAVAPAPAAPPAPAQRPAAVSPLPPSVQATAINPHLYELRSPLVGVYYRAPSPDSPPYVEPGDLVRPGQTVCMIEAMKVFNEIHAEKPGRVVEVCAENGEVVEADQVLMRLDPQHVPAE